MPRKKISGVTPPYTAPGDELGPKVTRVDDVSCPIVPAVKDGVRALLSLVEKPLAESLPPPIKDGKVTVTMIKDHVLTLPEMYLDIHVAGDRREEIAFAGMFSRARCKRADSPEKADLVIFTGGEDVDPALYDEERHGMTWIDRKRDVEDMSLYAMCLEQGIPMFGVCRGAQFLHVMNGGKLYQHVDNHHGDHSIWDVKERKKLDRVSSVHHQMVIPQNQNGFQLIATANVARNRWRNPKENDMGTKIDVEAFWYRDTCCFGVQGHPEYKGYNQFAKWTLEYINELICLNPDIKVKDGNYRLRQEFLEEREAREKKKLSALV